MRHLWHKTTALLLMLLTTVAAWGQSRHYEQLSALPSKRLLEMGSNYIDHRSMPDSALLCFSIVAARGDRGQSEVDRLLGIDALVGRWYVYFFHYFDYSKAFENLSRAQELAQKEGKNQGRILLDFGCMYQTIGEQSGENKPLQQALEYYRKSFDTAMEIDDWDTSIMAVNNMITVAAQLHRLPEIEGAIDRFSQSQAPKLESFTFLQLQFEGLLAIEQNRLPQALAAFERQVSITPSTFSESRYMYNAVHSVARVLHLMGRNHEAIARLTVADSIAQRMGLKDAKLETYQLMTACYQALGDNDQATKWQNRYFAIKDSLLNYHQMASVSELQFQGEIKRIDDQMRDIDHKRQIEHMIMLVVALVALLLVVLAVVIWRNNRRLRATNEALYRNIQSALKAEDELQAIAAPQQQPSEPKYGGRLADEDKQQVMQAVTAALDKHAHELLSTDFDLTRLAELAGQQPRNVSQVINETTGDNFNALINERRIREACRRLGDEQQWGHLTIEAVGSSVGFKSRSAFIAAFKRFTGLKPSEYKKIAKEQHHKQEN